MAKHKRWQGADALGKFRVEMVIADFVFVKGKGSCPICNKDSSLVVCYQATPKVSSYVKAAKSFLLRASHKYKGGAITSPDKVRLHRRVGINCGCYAKVHRQIAHIQAGSKNSNKVKSP